MAYHECWVIINKASRLIAHDGVKYEVYCDEEKAWEECIRLNKTSVTQYTVKKTRLPLLWIP